MSPPALPDPVARFGYGPFQLATDLAHLEAVHGSGAYPATILYGGRILEALSCAAMDALTLPPHRVYANLVALEQTWFLRPPFAAWAHALRRAGNEARHLGREISGLDAELAVVLTERWLRWFFGEFGRGPRLEWQPAAGLGLASPELSALMAGIEAGASLDAALLLDKPLLAAAQAERLVDARAFDPAEDLLLRALARTPADTRLRQIRALLHSRRAGPGDLARAAQLLGELASGRSRDEETLGLWGSVLRRQALAARGAERAAGPDAEAPAGGWRDLLDRSTALYQEGWAESDEQNVWLGVNAATGELLAGRTAKAARLAGTVQEVVRARRAVLRPGETLDFWNEVTEAEALVVSGDRERAWDAYHAALGAGAPEGRRHASVRQLGMLLEALGCAPSASGASGGGPEDARWREAGEAWLSGARPRTVRVGVTGHRRLADPEGVSARLRAALAHVLETPCWVGAGLALHTALAEGADQLAAEVAASEPFRGAVHPVLPLAIEEYRRDFRGEALQAFQRLLGAARRPEVVPLPAGADPRVPGDRERAYLAGGLALLDRCEVLLTVWDGQPARGVGGTAEIVAAARQRGLPVAWIDAAPGGGVRYERWPAG